MARKAIPVERINEDFAKMAESAKTGTPLACAVLSAAFVERALVTLLTRFFCEKSTTAESLLSEKGRLSDFATCADVAYALGLISNGHKDHLQLIARIRNLFAHSYEDIDFDNTVIKQLCSQMQFPTISPLPTSLYSSDIQFQNEYNPENPRHRFTRLCSLSYYSLEMVIQGTRHRDVWKDSWRQIKDPKGQKESRK